jgi:hypothetical protein
MTSWDDGGVVYLLADRHGATPCLWGLIGLLGEPLHTDQLAAWAFQRGWDHGGAIELPFILCHGIAHGAILDRVKVAVDVFIGGHTATQYATSQ